MIRRTVPLAVPLAVLLAVLVAPAVAQDTRVLLEPETFNNLTLQRYPHFNEKADQWYAMEATCRSYGAQGEGYCAVIHGDAPEGKRTIRTTLDQPLPPGTYKVFLSSCGIYWKEQIGERASKDRRGRPTTAPVYKPNILRVQVGDAVSKVEWTRPKNRFMWIEGGQIELAEPAKDVRLTAVQFGGKGFAHLYESTERIIPVDQIYITSDLEETTGPSIRGANVIAGDRAAPREMITRGGDYRTVRPHQTPDALAEPKTYPITLKAFDGRKNLLPNSSFELGGGDGWASANSSQGQKVHVFSEKDHLASDPHHGQYALRCPGKGQGGLQFSRPMHLPAGGTYTLSGYVRALADGEKVQFGGQPTARQVSAGLIRLDGRKLLDAGGLKTKAPVGPQWQRFEASGKLEEGTYLLAVWGPCALDAMQLEAGAAATDYAPRADVEASLSTDAFAHIQYSDKPATLVAWAHNATDAPRQATLRYRMVDVRERGDADTITLTVPAGKTVRKEVVLRPTLNGLFNVVYAAQGRPFAEGELIYTVLPPLPEGMPRHALASNMDNDPHAQRLMQAMGHKWQLYCKLYADRPENLNKQPGQYNWDALRKVVTMPDRWGMETMPALWPTHLPGHLIDPAKCDWASYGNGKRDPTRQIKNGRIPSYPDLDKWAAYCRKVAENVGDVQPWWTIEDETELYYSPRDFAPIVLATAKGFGQSGKEMKVSLSCTGDYTEEMIEELDGQVPLAGFGGSSYDYEYWDARKARYLQRKYDVPWSCIGVGVGRSPQFRRIGPFGEDVYGRAVGTAQDMVLLAIGQDAKVLGHYTGRLWFRGALGLTDFPLMDYDCTPLVHGYAYSCIPLLVADAVPVEDVYLDALRTLVFVFRQNGRLHAVTWANNTPHLDIHWKTDPKVWRDVTLAGADGKVRVADMFGNRRADVNARGGDLVFDLTEEPTFFFNEGLDDTAFLKMIRGITAAPRPVAMRLAFLPNGSGGVDLGVYAENHTGRTLSGLKLDANFPPNRMVSRTAWTLPDRIGQIGDVPAGKSTWGRLDTKIDGTVPIENATYTVWITQADGTEHRMYDTCWLTVARRLSARVDGKLPEWRKAHVHPAWMYYTYSWSRFGRHNVQIERKSEAFKYCFRVDAQAAIYSGHDDKNLYLAIRCEDDDPRFEGAQRDTLEIKLNPRPGTNEGTKMLRVQPTGPAVRVTDADGKELADVAAAMTTGTDSNGHNTYGVYTIELAIPLSMVGGAKRPGEAIGFDVVWHDADNDAKPQDDAEKVITGTWRWAGRSTSLGTMLMSK